MFWFIVAFAVACLFVSMCFGDGALTLQAARVLDGAFRESVPSLAAPTAAKRPFLSPFTKKAVAAKQKWRCASCGKMLDETFEIDHIVPLFRGGDNATSNLQALHRACHMSKSAMDAQA